MRTINVYSAERYVIAAHSPQGGRKLFQIVCGNKDGTIFVTFPYYRKGGGRLGLVELEPSLSYPTNLKVGHNFPVTCHYVKYSHHPSGKAHFSLTGKVRTLVGKNSIPLRKASGHLFTIMIQGLDHFDSLEPGERGTSKRGLVPFPVGDAPVRAVKFVGHYYAEGELSRRIWHRDPTPWTKCIAPDGTVRVGIPLSTTFSHQGERRYLILTGECIDTICRDQEVFMSFMGGFDHPDVAYDHSEATSFLMFIYPTFTDLRSLAQTFGTIDVEENV